MVIFGSRCGALASAEETAEWVGTVNSEVVSTITAGVPRVVV